jgi:hypothetical protein
VVALPNDQARIQTIMEGCSTAEYSMMANDQSAVASTRTKEPRTDKGRQYMEQSPPPAAAALVVTAPLSIQVSVVSQTPPPTMPCLFSPSAPQVEDYALDAVPIPSNLEQATLMSEKQPEVGPAPRDVRPRTRSTTRVERLVIPSSLHISDS